MDDDYYSAAASHYMHASAMATTPPRAVTPEPQRYSLTHTPATAVRQRNSRHWLLSATATRRRSLPSSCSRSVAQERQSVGQQHHHNRTNSGYQLHQNSSYNPRQTVLLPGGIRSTGASPYAFGADMDDLEDQYRIFNDTNVNDEDTSVVRPLLHSPQAAVPDMGVPTATRRDALSRRRWSIADYDSDNNSECNNEYGTFATREDTRPFGGSCELTQPPPLIEHSQQQYSQHQQQQEQQSDLTSSPFAHLESAPRKSYHVRAASEGLLPLPREGSIDTLVEHEVDLIQQRRPQTVSVVPFVNQSLTTTDDGDDVCEAPESVNSSVLQHASVPSLNMQTEEQDIIGYHQRASSAMFQPPSAAVAPPYNYTNTNFSNSVNTVCGSDPYQPLRNRYISQLPPLTPSSLRCPQVVGPQQHGGGFDCPSSNSDGYTYHYFSAAAATASAAVQQHEYSMSGQLPSNISLVAETQESAEAEVANDIAHLTMAEGTPTQKRLAFDEVDDNEEGSQSMPLCSSILFPPTATASESGSPRYFSTSDTDYVSCGAPSPLSMTAMPARLAEVSSRRRPTGMQLLRSRKRCVEDMLCGQPALDNAAVSAATPKRYRCDRNFHAVPATVPASLDEEESLTATGQLPPCSIPYTRHERQALAERESNVLSPLSKVAAPGLVRHAAQWDASIA